VLARFAEAAALRSAPASLALLTHDVAKIGAGHLYDSRQAARDAFHAARLWRVAHVDDPGQPVAPGFPG
jgi:hypothetical protein